MKRKGFDPPMPGMAPLRSSWMSDPNSTLPSNSNYLVLACFLIQAKWFSVSCSRSRTWTYLPGHRSRMFPLQVLKFVSPKARWRSCACWGKGWPPRQSPPPLKAMSAPKSRFSTWTQTSWIVPASAFSFVHYAEGTDWDSCCPSFLLFFSRSGQTG